MARTSEGVVLKNGGAGSTRATKGNISIQSRGRFGFDHSVAVKDVTAPSGQRVLYMNRADLYDLADVADVLLEAEEGGR